MLFFICIRLCMWIWMIIKKLFYFLGCGFSIEDVFFWKLVLFFFIFVKIIYNSRVKDLEVVRRD